MSNNGSTSAFKGASYRDFAEGAEIVDHLAPRKPIRFVGVRMEKNEFPKTVDPLGTSNRAPELEPNKRSQQPVPPPPAMKLDHPAPEPIQTHKPVSLPEKVESLPLKEEVSLKPVAKEVPKQILPEKKVDFVGDVMDVEIPCFEVIWDEKNQYLSLVIQSNQKLKLEAGQSVNIRVNGVEAFYWFTGITVPITVLGATTLVFGKTLE